MAKNDDSPVFSEHSFGI